ncbi:MAG: spermidine synthase [Candidatus Nitricoxidivorans perseverans]|uniref:Spermidine synthase n=1 Tax=Candidatus Nitricoxidivorans perseverans TaxID=2975601 RepID=A0AA49IYL9_9PROT|nr:MAG: spermidine synthase [Candidatus Nitricoxidivorans perseverans]
MSFGIDIREEAGVRTLHFGSDWIQGAMRIARPFALELDYTREMMAGLLLRPEPDWPKQVLLIGLGAGSLTKFLRRHRPGARLTVVEIEPRVVAVARQFFRLPDEDERLRIVIGEGADFVAGSRGTFDLILVDGFDENARTGELESPRFYLNCKARLGDEGLLAANLLSKRRDFRDSVARIAEAFDGRALAFPSCDSGNAIAFAATGAAVDHTLPDLRAAARTLKRDTGLNLLPTLARLEGSRHCAGGRLVV